MMDDWLVILNEVKNLVFEIDDKKDYKTFFHSGRCDPQQSSAGVFRDGCKSVHFWKDDPTEKICEDGSGCQET